MLPCIEGVTGLGVLNLSHPNSDSAACMWRLSQVEAMQLLPVSISVLVFLLVGCCGACLLRPVREDRTEPRVCGPSHHRTLCRVSDGTRCPPIWGDGLYPPSGGLKFVWMPKPE